jgi:hypothetical protein
MFRRFASVALISGVSSVFFVGLPVVAEASPNDCSWSYFKDSEFNTGVAAHCNSGDGKFRARAVCVDGAGVYTVYGNWVSPGVWSFSYALCPGNGLAVGGGYDVA